MRSQSQSSVLAAILLLAGCDTSDPTMAAIDNQYPEAADADITSQTTVYKAWWSVAMFTDPVSAGQESDAVRVVPGTDYAYALLARGWDPSSGAAPSTLIPVRTAGKVTVARGGTLHIAISRETTVGDCAEGRPLSPEDASMIVQRIFPGDFAGVLYDPATCATTALPDGGGDMEGGSDDGRSPSDGAIDDRNGDSSAAVVDESFDSNADAGD